MHLMRALLDALTRICYTYACTYNISMYVHVNIQKYKGTQRHQHRELLRARAVRNKIPCAAMQQQRHTASSASSGHRRRQRSCCAAHASLLIYKLSQPLCVQLSVMCQPRWRDIQTNIRTFVCMFILSLRSTCERACMGFACVRCSCMRVRSCVMPSSILKVRTYVVCIYVWTFLHNITYRHCFLYESLKIAWVCEQRDDDLIRSDSFFS